jgi:AraC-like DNA-binding protein
MVSRVYFPQPPLSTFVELFWSFEGYQPPHVRERVLPTGTTTLILRLDQATTNLYGAHSEFFTIDTAQSSSFIGVHFRPGGAFPFLGLPVSEVHNEVVLLETLWGARATEVREQLLEAPTMHTKFQTLEKVLQKCLTHPPTAHPAVSFALREIQTAPRLASITDQLGLSSRRFSQVFAHEVGLTPKLFQRVLRFQGVLHAIEKHKNIDWSEIALSCDYFDQAHFIHDFKAFSGLTPERYLEARGKRLNHLPLAD